MVKKKILFIVNSPIGSRSNRIEIIQNLLRSGFDVLIVEPERDVSNYVESIGCKVQIVGIDRHGINPFVDLKLILVFNSIIRSYKPDVILTFTIKPNLYGSIAARSCNVPCLPNITGLGMVFQKRKILQLFVLKLYKYAFRDIECVFFQNSYNRDFLKKRIRLSHSVLLPGSGIDLKKHIFEDYPKETSSIKLIYIGRLMHDKGVGELFEAIKIIKDSNQRVSLTILGDFEEEYRPIVFDMVERDLVDYKGFQSDVHGFIKDCHALVLPSYHEGMANVLLEAAACGRPILASNIPGCRETFDEGISGFGFEPRSVDSLVSAMKKFINLPYDKKREMGLAGRKKMECEFDRNIVVSAYMEEINRILAREDA